MGDLRFSQERFQNDPDYRKDAFKAMLRKPFRPRKRLSYNVKGNLEAVNAMKKMNIWPALRTPEAIGQGSAIARHFQIKERTVRNWIEKLQKDPTWEGPLRKKDPNKDFVFNQEQESGLENIVLEYTQNHHLGMKSETFKQITSQVIEDERIEVTRNFNFSPKWISNFKKRYNFTSRRGHLKRRPKASKEDIQAFKLRVAHILETAEGDHVINADESPWHFNEKSLTWAIKGSENVVIEGDQKSCFTFLGAINGNNELLPPVFISAGKTSLTEKNWFGEAHSIKSWDESKEWNYLTDHTKSGWTNRRSWKRYILFLRKYIPIDPEKNDEQNRIYLICDGYRPHIPNPNNPDDPFKEFLDENNIEIIKVPEGTTDQCQPLDCRIFGALKSRVRKVINNKEARYLRQFLNGYHIKEDFKKMPLTKTQMKDFLVQGYYETSASLIQEAWNKPIYSHLEN